MAEDPEVIGETYEHEGEIEVAGEETGVKREEIPTFKVGDKFMSYILATDSSSCQLPTTCRSIR